MVCAGCASGFWIAQAIILATMGVVAFFVIRNHNEMFGKKPDKPPEIAPKIGEQPQAKLPDPFNAEEPIVPKKVERLPREAGTASLAYYRHFSRITVEWRVAVRIAKENAKFDNPIADFGALARELKVPLERTAKQFDEMDPSGVDEVCLSFARKYRQSLDELQTRLNQARFDKVRDRFNLEVLDLLDDNWGRAAANNSAFAQWLMDRYGIDAVQK